MQKIEFGEKLEGKFLFSDDSENQDIENTMEMGFNSKEMELRKESLSNLLQISFAENLQGLQNSSRVSDGEENVVPT